MRIGFVTQWFPPEPGTVVAAAVAEGLASRGHDVHVLTGFPNYPTGILHPDYALRPYRKEILGERLTVHRAPLYPSHDRSGVHRMANYLSFAAAATAVGWLRVPRPDAWLVYSSPATAAIPALLSRGARARPTFLLIQDLWPDSVTDSGFLTGRTCARIDGALSRYCAWTYRRARAIGVISPGMRDVLIARGVPEARLFDTPNWIAGPEVGVPAAESERRGLRLPDGRLFMYAGNLGQMQGLDHLVSAFAKVPDSRLIVIGDGVARDQLAEQIRRENARNVMLLGHVPQDEIGRYVAASDVQVVSLRDTPLLRSTMPSKLQSSLAAGKPVLAHAAGDVADLIAGHSLGAVAPPGDLKGSVDAIRSLVEAPSEALTEMGRLARRVFDHEFSPEAGLDRLERMLAAPAEGSREHAD